MWKATGKFRSKRKRVQEERSGKPWGETILARVLSPTERVYAKVRECFSLVSRMAKESAVGFSNEKAHAPQARYNTGSLLLFAFFMSQLHFSFDQCSHLSVVGVKDTTTRRRSSFFIAISHIIMWFALQGFSVYASINGEYCSKNEKMIQLM